MAENSGDLSLGYMMGQSENGGGGFGGNFGEGLWAVIILAILFGRGGFGGFGGFGGGNDCGGGCATQADVRAAVDQQTLISKLDQQTYGLADATYALNNTINSGFYGVDRSICDLSHQISDCCCTTQRSIDNVNYNMASQFCALGNTIQTSTRDINDTIRDGFARMEAQANARYISDLERKLNACDRDSALQGLGTYLINTLRPSPIPAYQSCNPWANCGGNWNGCNCGC